MIKVLVIDDDLEILEVVELLLTRSGFNVRKVSDAGQTIAQVETYNPTVILMDINLCGHDGRLICKHLKSGESPFKEIPVILFSAMHNLKHAFTEYNATDFVSKPFDSIKLIEKIRKHAA